MPAGLLQGRDSLSKVYRLIERFSEDVDVLVALPKTDELMSANQRGRALERWARERNWWSASEAAFRLVLVRMSSAVLVQTKGTQRSFQALMKCRMASASATSRTEVNEARRIAHPVMIAKKESTRFSHDEWVESGRAATVGYRSAACSLTDAMHSSSGGLAPQTQSSARW